MSTPLSFYWHDYETFGANPAYDRPCQFAGLRTDANLNQIGDPLVVFCKPPVDYLPSPEACLITGITPQLARDRGMIEADFIARILQELAQPGTCGVGYNSLRFDDEVTRFTLYRNFRDPYEREWKNGNSRWDLIDVMRMARALRPEGLEWPDYDDGTPSFRLEDLSRANGIEHSNAHDALADVYATLALARRLRDKHQKLFDYALKAREKEWVRRQFNLMESSPVLHFASTYASENAKAAVLIPVALPRSNKNAVICCNLLLDPEPLAKLSAQELRKYLFMRRADRTDDMPVVPLVQIQVNRCPIIAPIGMLADGVDQRLNIDLKRVRERYEQVRAIPGLNEKLQSLFAYEGKPSRDPDSALYGGFIPDNDKLLMEEVVAAPPDELATMNLRFQDPRLPELLFRYRARNFPDSLDNDEQVQWQQHIAERVNDPDVGLAAYRSRIRALKSERVNDPAAQEILTQLDAYGDEYSVYESA